MNVQVTLPLPLDKWLNPNGWHKGENVIHAINAARKKARELAQMAFFVATRRPSFAGNLDKCRAGYSLYIMYCFKLNTDVDNIVARCKSYIDGMSDALDINDRDINLLITQKQKAFTGEAGVYMSLTDFDLNKITRNDGKELF